MLQGKLHENAAFIRPLHSNHDARLQIHAPITSAPLHFVWDPAFTWACARPHALIDACEDPNKVPVLFKDYYPIECWMFMCRLYDVRSTSHQYVLDPADVFAPHAFGCLGAVC